LFDLDAYVHVPVCEDAINSENTFNNFKSDKRFTAILEHTAPEYSQIFLQRMIEEYPDEFSLIDWDKVRENDSVGGPFLLEYEHVPSNNKLFSPSTIAYTFKALEILDHIKKSNLNNVKIIEIGAGYGGQCKSILDLAALFDIQIESYTLVDLYWPNQLQKKYLNNLGYVDKLTFISYEDLLEGEELPEFDYLISIYALAEFSDNVKQFYIDKIKNFRYHYLVWNTPSVHEKFLLSDIEEERPKTGPYNSVIKSKVN
jgi:hypothetical protein